MASTVKNKHSQRISGGKINTHVIPEEIAKQIPENVKMSNIKLDVIKDASKQKQEMTEKPKPKVISS